MTEEIRLKPGLKLWDGSKTITLDELASFVGKQIYDIPAEYATFWMDFIGVFHYNFNWVKELIDRHEDALKKCVELRLELLTLKDQLKEQGKTEEE